MKRLILILALTLSLIFTFASCSADAPTIEISEDGYWVINGEKTDVKAEGTQGPAGEKGDTGVQGPAGEKGEQGIPGKDGAGAVDENPLGLAFFLKDDGTYAVEIGQAKYLSEIEIPATYKGKAVTEVGSFGNVSTDNLILKKISIADGIKTIGKSAFDRCKNLESVTLPDSLTTIENSAFRHCRSLTSIEIPDGVTYIGNSAFYSCTTLTDVSIPDSVTTIDNYAFYDCDSLVSVSDGANVTTIGSYAFAYCNNLVSLTIPSGLTSAGVGVFESSNRLVEIINKSSLDIRVNAAPNTIEVHNGESKIINKDGFIFYPFEGTSYLVSYAGCDTELALPDSFNGEGYEIHSYAFYESAITSITIPDSVTAIGDQAFDGCTSLTSVTIGSGVSYIGEYAFNKCAVKSVTLRNLDNWYHKDKNDTSDGYPVPEDDLQSPEAVALALKYSFNYYWFRK